MRLLVWQVLANATLTSIGGLLRAWQLCNRRAALAHLLVCSHCQYEAKVSFPHGKKTEDPQYCQVCNP